MDGLGCLAARATGGLLGLLGQGMDWVVWAARDGVVGMDVGDSWIK